MPNAVTLMSEYCSDARRATLTNAMFCGFPLGAAFGGFLAAWMIPQFGWRSVLVLGGAAATDVGLPGLNGRQMADAARERRPSLPVLFITGYAGTALDRGLPPAWPRSGSPSPSMILRNGLRPCWRRTGADLLGCPLVEDSRKAAETVMLASGQLACSVRA
jgi:MFS family permease